MLDVKAAQQWRMKQTPETPDRAENHLNALATACHNVRWRSKIDKCAWSDRKHGKHGETRAKKI